MSARGTRPDWYADNGRKPRSGRQIASLTGRYLNALCYLVSGVFMLAAKHTDGWAIPIGLASIAYSLYVGLTRNSYWVSAATYVIPIILIAIAVAT